MQSPSEDGFLTRADQLASAIRDELEASQDSPGARPTARQMVVVLRRIEAMRSHVRAGSVPPRPSRHRRLSRLVVDEWPLGHPLALQISDLEDLWLTL